MTQQAKQNLVASAATTIDAPLARTWDALIDAKALRAWMFGSKVESDWRPGSAITWKGEWQGKPYEDHGKILRITPRKLLEYTHFSPLMGQPDVPDNYHTVTIELTGDGDGTRVVLTQDNNATEDAAAHSRKNWESALEALKKYVEKQR